MIIDDPGLSRLALGIATTAGVLLAILISIFVFVWERFVANDREALRRVRSSANDLYELFLLQADRARLYLEETGPREWFIGLITLLSRVDSSDGIPDFVRWRQQTAEVIAISSTRTNEIMDLDENIREFHTRFVDNMWELDSAVRFSFAMALMQRRLVEQLKRLTTLIAVVLEGSLSVALAAEIKYGQGLSDTWNLIPAVVLAALLAGTLIALVPMLRDIGTTSDEWIERAIRTDPRVPRTDSAARS